MVALARSNELVSWVFVDNSPDGSDAAQLRLISDRAKNILIVERRDNPGFAAGSNYGFTLGDGDWVFFLNPDITLTDQDLKRIGAFIAGPPEADSIAVSQVTRGFAHAGVGSTFYGWFTDRPVGSGLALLGPSGGAGLYRRSAFEAYGGFFEPLFAWGEDADLALRMVQRGSKCVELDLRLQHQGQHSVSSSKRASSFKARLLTRNRLLVAGRNLSPWRAWRFAVVHMCVIVLMTPRNWRRGTVLATWHGYCDGIRSLAGAFRLSANEKQSAS